MLIKRIFFNKRMRPITTTVIVIVWSRCSMLYMARTNLPTYFRIASCMRSAILNTSMFHWDGFGLLTFALTEASAKEIGYFSTVFFQRWLPIILPWTITEKCCVHNLVALSLSARTGWQWAGPKFHSLLSAHRLIGVCFLTTESDKHMRLLTRLYGNHLRTCWQFVSSSKISFSLLFFQFEW